MRDRLTKVLPPVLSFAAVLFLWQGVVWLFRPAPFLLPGIDRVVGRLVTFGANWPKHVIATVESIVLGFAVAVLFGVAGAVHVGLFSDTVSELVAVLLRRAARVVHAGRDRSRHRGIRGVRRGPRLPHRDREQPDGYRARHRVDLPRVAHRHRSLWRHPGD